MSKEKTTLGKVDNVIGWVLIIVGWVFAVVTGVGGGLALAGTSLLGILASAGMVGLMSVGLYYLSTLLD